MINTKIETIYIFVALGIYTNAGIKIGSYKYDAWGNVTSTTISDTTTLQKQIVRQYNPFRYRGYYYDTQTSLYYLQSRYYDPATGRFINADGYINANGDLIGYNMYAYCSNNPVMYVDYTGNRYEVCPIIQSFVEAVVKYVNNTDPQVVKDAKLLAFYKGVPVIKIDFICDWFFEGQDQGASFGVIFISSNHVDFEQVLRHEYGHVIQFYILGPVVYTTEIAIPSVNGYFEDRKHNMGDAYFNQPWEITADIFGGVDLTKRKAYTAEAAKEGIEYFKNAILKGFGISKYDREKFNIHPIHR